MSDVFLMNIGLGGRVRINQRCTHVHVVHRCRACCRHELHTYAWTLFCWHNSVLSSAQCWSAHVAKTKSKANTIIGYYRISGTSQGSVVTKTFCILSALTVTLRGSTADSVVLWLLSARKDVLIASHTYRDCPVPPWPLLLLASFAEPPLP